MVDSGEHIRQYGPVNTQSQVFDIINPWYSCSEGLGGLTPFLPARQVSSVLLKQLLHSMAIGLWSLAGDVSCPCRQLHEITYWGCRETWAAVLPMNLFMIMVLDRKTTVISQYNLNFHYISWPRWIELEVQHPRFTKLCTRCSCESHANEDEGSNIPLMLPLCIWKHILSCHWCYPAIMISNHW